MSRIVLVHGAWHGAWCWYKVIPLLERHGHTVIAPDLPGHGVDRTPLNRVNLDGYTKRLCEVLDDGEEPALLVGHSMGGIAVTRAAELRPDRVHTLVYVAGFLLPDGRSLLEEAQTDPDTLVLPNLVFPENDPSYVDLRADALREIFYGDCSDADFALVRTVYKSQPQSPLLAPVHTSAENFGRVPRVYIETLLDQAITPPAQKRMYTARPCEKVISMNTAHSPFFSAPGELVEHLLSLA